jgi:hypothetical protein
VRIVGAGGIKCRFCVFPRSRCIWYQKLSVYVRRTSVDIVGWIRVLESLSDSSKRVMLSWLDSAKAETSSISIV